MAAEATGPSAAAQTPEEILQGAWARVDRVEPPFRQTGTGYGVALCDRCPIGPWMRGALDGRADSPLESPRDGGGDAAPQAAGDLGGPDPGSHALRAIASVMSTPPWNRTGTR